MPDNELKTIEISPVATLNQKRNRNRGFGRPDGRPKKSIFDKQDINFTVFLDLQESSLANDLLQITATGTLSEMCRLLIKEEGVRRLDELKDFWKNKHSTQKEGEPEE